MKARVNWLTPLKWIPWSFVSKISKTKDCATCCNTPPKAFGWAKIKPATGRGFGLACGFEQGGCIATCAEIAIEKAARKNNNATVRIVRVIEAFECGAVVNPLHLENQIEGAIAQTGPASSTNSSIKTNISAVVPKGLRSDPDGGKILLPAQRA